MTKKIFITRKIPDRATQLLTEKGYTVDVYPKDTIPSTRKLAKILKKGEYDAVLCLLTDKIDATLFDATPLTRCYVNYATGYDNMDVSEAKKRGITLANSPADLSAEAVAEHTIALMLALAARIVEADTYMRSGKYTGFEPMLMVGTDILGMTLGLVGAGRIGGRVAHYAKGLGMKIIYTDVARNTKIEEDCGAEYYASTEEVLKRADVVSIHVPLLDSTRHLINETHLQMMKPTAFLINTSRGPVVDEAALERALKNKIIGGAALDVFEFEPKITRGMTKLTNVILTPHIASASIATRNQMAEVAANNIIDFLEGGIPRNSVTK